MPIASRADKYKKNDVSAEELFTDREEPRKAFWDIYESMQPGAYEVLSYYGLGGIGKTSLLIKLCHELEEKVASKKPNYAFFSFEGNADKEVFLFSLSRKMMLSDDKISFPLFDTALIKIANDEGKDLNKFVEKAKESFVKKPLVETAVKIGGQVVPGLEAAVDIVDKVWSFASTKISEKERQTGKNAHLYHKIESDSNVNLRKDLQKYFWEDVYEFMEKRETPYVVFIDGYENYVNIAKNGNLAEGKDNWISKDLIDIPNVLWVIAGREKLNWDEEILPSDHQHRIGDLSEFDVVDFFRKAGIVDEELVKGLYELTHGTPAYLDICRNTYIEVSKKKTPEIDDFGKDTSELVNRYLEKLDKEDQKIMVMLSFLPKVWDLEMAQAVAENLGYRAYLDNLDNLVKLSLFEPVENGIKMHETSRMVIRNGHQDRQERISIEIVKYLADVLLNSENAMDFMQISMQFAEAMEMCNSAIISVDDMAKIHWMMKKEIAYKSEFVNGEYVYSILEDKMLSLGYPPELVADCMIYRSANFACLGKYQLSLDASIKAVSYTKGHIEEKPGLYLRALSSLGRSHMSLGNFVDARSLFEHIYNVRRKTLGEEHRVTIDALECLADVNEKMGEYKTALIMYNQVYEVNKRGRGAQDLNTIRVLRSMANTCMALREYELALSLSQEVYEYRLNELGEKHPSTLSILSDMALAYNGLGEFEKALALQKQVYEDLQNVVKAEDPDTIRAMDNLAGIYRNLGEFEEALALLEQAYNTRVRISGDADRETMRMLFNLACVARDLGDYEYAKSLFVQLYNRQMDKLGEFDLDTLNTKRVLEDFGL